MKEKRLQVKKIDAAGYVLGRLASKISKILQGKDQPSYLSYKGGEKEVWVYNAEKIKLTGKKADLKIYYHHTGYPGGLKAEKLKDRLKRNPEEVIKDAVIGMLPKNKLRKIYLKRLKFFQGSENA